MTNLRESLQRVPVNLRFALLTELQELDGYQNADLSALANENELLAALASAVNGIAQAATDTGPTKCAIAITTEATA